MKVKFWGVRGSVPSPLTPAQVEEKIFKAIQDYAHMHDTQPRDFCMNTEEYLWR